MAQLVRMDARLNTLSDELCKIMGGFTTYTFPSPPTSEDEGDDGSSSDDADKDEDASSLSDDEMST